MKLIFIAPEEPMYLPKFFDKIFTESVDEVQCVVVISAVYKGHSYRKQLLKFVRAFGVKDCIVECSYILKLKILNVFSNLNLIKGLYSVSSAAKKHNLIVLSPEDISSDSFVKKVESYSPDLLVSVSSPQVFSGELIRVAKYGCINIHGSKLPRYRGVLPSFWMLRNNEKMAGVTVHYIDEKIDSGDILMQENFQIVECDTLHTLIGKSKEIGANLLLKALHGISSGGVQRKINRIDEGEYYSFPKKSDVIEFRKNGRRLR